MRPDQAAALGFFTRTGGTGDGDGDGFVTNLGTNPGLKLSDFGGENVLFWTDLSAAGLVDGSFNDNGDALLYIYTDSQFAAEMPLARIGNGNYVHVNAYYDNSATSATQILINGFQIIRPSNIAGGGWGVNLHAGLTPLESSTIDQKIDDGYPLSGHVIAMCPDSTWNATTGDRAGLAATATTCAGSLCVLPGPPVIYNVGTPGVSTVANCSLRFNAPW